MRVFLTARPQSRLPLFFQLPPNRMTRPQNFLPRGETQSFAPRHLRRLRNNSPTTHSGLASLRFLQCWNFLWLRARRLRPPSGRFSAAPLSPSMSANTWKSFSRASLLAAF
ncbi:UBA/TS-N domain-containing protein [Toxoplasma gondii RUB]|uniref:UBA/TS-N domain-containing protein n=1 Tax=Toxoplasma gondii RUB TaxID=935652 RepID=A0A086LYA0_TOXGO|nr:UBA/TS-N domain-containing protein [Toxoplasma gondii RUB]